MSAPLRPRLLPQCTSCVRSYSLAGLDERWARFGGLATQALPGFRQQVRGVKKKADSTTGTLAVRLLKDVPTFGRKGAIVPVSQGQMRNKWFPRRIAAYITMPEMKQLRISNTAIERDFDFAGSDATDGPSAGRPYPGNATTAAQPEIPKISPERSIELVEIFVPRRLDFYRQQVMEEVEAATTSVDNSAVPTQEPTSKDSGAGTDPLASRGDAAPSSDKGEKVVVARSKAVYEPVRISDILTAIRAAMERNDEAKYVALQESDIVFAGNAEVATTGEVWKLGVFEFEIRIEGVETVVRRVLNVNPQES